MKMPVINVTVPAQIHRLLVKLAAESGKSVSATAAECIEIGMDKKLEAANRRAVFLAMEDKRQHQKAMVEDDE